MSEENNTINESNKEVNEPTNVKIVDETYLERFKELKEGFDKELAKRDKEIEELKAQLEAKNNVVNETIDELNSEVKDNLRQAEEFREMQANMNQLLAENAEIAIDSYIKEGKIVPAQRDVAKDLYLKDRETFDKLFENAPSIVDTSTKSQSKKDNVDINKIAEYFKN